MFQSAVHEVYQKQSVLREEAELRTSSALKAVAQLSDVLTDSLNEEVREVHSIYETQKLLEGETQLLRRELAGTRAALAGWQAQLRGLAAALKEAGDLEHYAEHLAAEAELIARVSEEHGLLGGGGGGGGGAGGGVAGAGPLAAAARVSQGGRAALRPGSIGAAADAPASGLPAPAEASQRKGRGSVHTSTSAGVDGAGASDAVGEAGEAGGASLPVSSLPLSRSSYS